MGASSIKVPTKHQEKIIPDKSPHHQGKYPTKKIMLGQLTSQGSLFINIFLRQSHRYVGNVGLSYFYLA